MKVLVIKNDNTSAEVRLVWREDGEDVKLMIVEDEMGELRYAHRDTLRSMNGEYKWLLGMRVLSLDGCLVSRYETRKEMSNKMSGPWWEQPWRWVTRRSSRERDGRALGEEWIAENSKNKGDDSS